MTVRSNSRGQRVMEGRVLPGSTEEGRGVVDREFHADRALMEYLFPDLDSVILEIERETQALRLAGRLRLFREGEPIGRYTKRGRSRRLRPESVRDHKRRMEDERAEMLRMRAANDAEMRRLLR